MEMRDVMRNLRQEWLAAAAAFVLVIAAAVAVAQSTKATFSSSSDVLVQQGSTTSSVQAVEFLMPALEARVSSRPLEDQVRAGLGAAYQSTTWSAVGAADPGTGLLKLTVTSPSRAAVQPVADAYAGAIQAYGKANVVPLNVSVVDPASSPQSLRPRKVALLGVSGLVLALLAAVAVASMRAGRSRRIRRELPTREHVPSADLAHDHSLA